MIMRLTDSIVSLDGNGITGKDGKRYLIDIPGKDTIGTIYVFDAGDPSRYGFIPDLRDLGDTLFQAGVAEFMKVHSQGLYKSLIGMISEVVPGGTKYKSSIYSPMDQNEVLDYVKGRERPDMRDALEKTCFGHVLRASKFSDVRLFYTDQSRGVSKGAEALHRFSKDTENGIYTTSHGTDLFLVGAKRADPKL